MKTLKIAFTLAIWGLNIGRLPAEVQHTTDSVDQIEKKLTARTAVLIDVREEVETKKGHIEAALLIPLSVLQEGQQTKEFGEMLKKRLPKKTVIYTYCASGGRSLLAAEILTGYGYDTRALKLGFNDLVKQGFVTAKPKP